MKNIILQLASSITRKVFWKIISTYNSLEYSSFRNKYNLSKDFKFNGNGILFYGNGNIDIGQNSYLGRHSTIQSVDGCSVKIGTGCQMSHFINMYTSNNAADKDYSNDKTMRSGDIIIGDYCWIGIKSTIIGPVTIGDNTCIAANSLVNRDIPPHSIAIGVPAKVVKFKSYLSKSQILELSERYRFVLSDDLIASLDRLK